MYMCMKLYFVIFFYPRGHRDSKEARVRLASLVQL